MRCCKECGSPFNLEKHHVVFRSKSKIMAHMGVNLIDLCSTCHRGKYGPHKNREKDLQYKREIQAKLKEKLFREYYSIEGIKKALKLNKTQQGYIEKYCALHKKGYNSEEVIRYMMGGRLY